MQQQTAIPQNDWGNILFPSLNITHTHARTHKPIELFSLQSQLNPNFKSLNRFNTREKDHAYHQHIHMMTNTCAWCRKRDLSDLLISRRFRANLWVFQTKLDCQSKRIKTPPLCRQTGPDNQANNGRSSALISTQRIVGPLASPRRTDGGEGGGWRTPTCCSTLPLARGGCARFRAGKSPDKEFDSRRLPPTTSSFSPRRTEGDNSTVTTFIHKSEGRLARL